MKPLNRKPLPGIIDKEYVDYVESMNDIKLRDEGYFSDISYLEKASETLDKIYKVDRIAVKKFHEIEGYQYKNDSDKFSKDYSFHLRLWELSTLAQGNHAANKQLHIIYEGLNWEDLGYKTPENLKLLSIASIDLSYSTGLGSIIDRIELAGINPENGKQDLIYGLEDYSRSELKNFKYFNKHLPNNKKDRYLLYVNHNDNKIHWRFLVQDRDEGMNAYIRIPYSFMIPTSDFNWKPICEMWLGQIPQEEYS